MTMLVASYWKDVIVIYLYDTESNNSKWVTNLHPPCSFEEFKLWFDISNLKVDVIQFKLPHHYDVSVSKETFETDFKEIEKINQAWKQGYD